jgi:hypothetical protein
MNRPGSGSGLEALGSCSGADADQGSPRWLLRSAWPGTRPIVQPGHKLVPDVRVTQLENRHALGSS